MTEPKPGSDKREQFCGDQEIGRGAKKKPYRKPEFRAEAVFETTALTCGKVHATQPQCHFNRKLS
jgi:hypothetical protein